MLNFQYHIEHVRTKASRKLQVLARAATYIELSKRLPLCGCVIVIYNDIR